MGKEGGDLKNTVAVGKRGQAITESRGEGGVEGIRFCLLYSSAFFAEGFEGKCICVGLSGLCSSHVVLCCVLCGCFWRPVCCRVCAWGHAVCAACERPAFHTSVPVPSVCRCILNNLLRVNVRTSWPRLVAGETPLESVPAGREGLWPGTHPSSPIF